MKWEDALHAVRENPNACAERTSWQKQDPDSRRRVGVLAAGGLLVESKQDPEYSFAVLLSAYEPSHDDVNADDWTIVGGN